MPRIMRKKQNSVEEKFPRIKTSMFPVSDACSRNKHRFSSVIQMRKNGNVRHIVRKMLQKISQIVFVGNWHIFNIMI